MKKILISVLLVLSFTGLSFAGTYLNLGADYSFIPNNDLFGSGALKISYFNGSLGYAWDFGLVGGLRYDHFGVDDQVSLMQNARFVSAIPAVELGYNIRFMDEKLIWWSVFRFGYAVSARYRLGVTDYKATAFVPAVSTAVLYQLHGQFYAGIEVGYRYFDVIYPELGGKHLNLSGMFTGITLMHLFK